MSRTTASGCLLGQASQVKSAQTQLAFGERAVGLLPGQGEAGGPRSSAAFWKLRLSSYPWFLVGFGYVWWGTGRVAVQDAR